MGSTVSWVFLFRVNATHTIEDEHIKPVFNEAVCGPLQRCQLALIFVFLLITEIQQMVKLAQKRSTTAMTTLIFHYLPRKGTQTDPKRLHMHMQMGTQQYLFLELPSKRHQHTLILSLSAFKPRSAEKVITAQKKRVDAFDLVQSSAFKELCLNS